MDDGIELRWDVTWSSEHQGQHSSSSGGHIVYCAMAADRFDVTRIFEVYCPECDLVRIHHYCLFSDRPALTSYNKDDLIGLARFIGGGMDVN